MANQVTVVMDIPALTQFKSWGGPLGQSFNRLMLETQFRAKMRAPKRTHAMAGSITHQKGGNPAGKGLSFKVGSWTVKYTFSMEEGTLPHPIHPKKPGGTLVFFWPKAGKVVAFKSVMHPGTKPYNFLKDGLNDAMNMWERGG